MRPVYSLCTWILIVAWLLVPAVPSAIAAAGQPDWRPEKPVEIVVPTAAGVSNWRCIFAPKGLTAAQRTFWENAMAEVNQTAEWRKDIDARNLIMKFMRGRDLESYLDGIPYKTTRSTMIDIGIVK